MRRVILVAGLILFGSAAIQAQTATITCLAPNGGFYVDWDNFRVLNQGETAEVEVQPEGSLVTLWSCGWDDGCQFLYYDPVWPGSSWQIINVGGAKIILDPLNLSETPTGSEVSVQPRAEDEYGNPLDAAPASFTFEEVTSTGETTVEIGNSGDPTPLTFKLGNPPTYYNLETTATFSGNIEICIDYSGINFTSEANTRLLHFTGAGWEDITTSVDVETHTICGMTASLSTFVVAETATPEEMLAGLLYKVMSLNLKKGISNALDSKLQAATDALIDAKTQNDIAAINMLSAFVNHVEAQRDGALTTSEADDLISSAEDIIEALCQQ